MTTPYARFFELSLDLLATANADGYFVELNPAWETTLGFSRDELRQKPFVEFVHPEDREATIREASRLFSGEVTVHFENRYLHKSGSYVWLSWSALVSKDDGLIFACARDISTAKRLLAERELALQERDQFSIISETTSDFVGIAGLDGRARYVNPAGLRMVGLTADALGTLSIAHFHPPDYAAYVGKEALPYAAQHGVWSGEGQLQTQDGRTIAVSQIIVALRDPQGTLTGFGTIMRDLTTIQSFQRLEQDLRNQQAALTEMVRAMSTPIIPITEQIVVMPLIGSMDHQRAEQFLEEALQGVELRRAQFVIIDITGLRHIDTSVAGLLIKASSALGLLGARVVLTGIRAELARTLVGLGVELRTVQTHSTLQSGIAYALRSLGQSLGTGVHSEPAGRSTPRRIV